MVNDNQSSGQGSSSTTGQGKQQTSDMSQGAAPTQQGSGSSAGAQQGSYAGSQGSGQGYGSSEAQRRQGEGQRGQSWQQPSSSALQTRGGGSVSPYGAYGAGPFSMMRRITDEMDRLFESFGLGRGFLPSEYGLGGSSLWGGEGSNALWSPHVEVSERDGKIVVAADLPGVKKADVSAEINPDSVVIQGQRQQESTRNERGYYHSERTYGSFYRVIPLPEGADVENAAATFRDGVLQIEIPAPKPQSRGRTLEIKGGDGDNSGSAGQGTPGTTGSRSGSGSSGSSERQR
jgi:HSP20 family protein